MTTSSTTHRDLARLSTYSGAPSLQPSLAMSTSTNASQYNAASTNASHDLQKRNSVRASNSPYQNGLSATNYGGAEKGAYSNHAAASTTSLASTDPRTQDIKSWGAGFERMQDARLEKQRYTMSGKKSDEVSITALGAKVERALGRRMVGQDAVFTPRRQELPAELPEKRSLEASS